MTRRSHDLDLMQHVDNEVELVAADRADVSGLIETDADVRKKVEALGELRELVRGHLELSADEIADRRFASMWREVDRAIGPEHVPETPGLWARLSAWFDRYRGHVITGAVSAGAVAALAIVLRPGSDPAIDVRNGPSMYVTPVSLRQPPAIESLDTPDGTGTILNLEDEDGHTAVIWVTPVDIVEGI